MAEKSVDELRNELRNLGYLTHGIERWFALDPWSSRTFWAELLAVSSKAVSIAAIFAALPLLVITATRNRPVPLVDLAILGLLDLVTAAVILFVLLVGIALLLKLRPNLALDSPAALTAMSIGLAGVPAAAIVSWWIGFGGHPTTVEVLLGGSLTILFVLIATLVFSASLLSFSIHEARRIPLVAQKDRTRPLVFAAIVVAAVIGGWVLGVGSEDPATPPSQIVVAPNSEKIVLVAVDGMTWKLFSAQRPESLEFAYAGPSAPLEGTVSSAERWATIGTGTAPPAHEVSAIEGVQVGGGGKVLQSVSRVDPMLDMLGAWIGATRRVPLPPTVRRRHYIWETFGGRGVRSAAVNWWVTQDIEEPNLIVASQAGIFARAGVDASDPVDLAIAIDALATSELARIIEEQSPRFATVYLPALDIVLNRLDLDAPARVAASVRASENLFSALASYRTAGYQVILLGMPGDGERGEALIATDLMTTNDPTPLGIAPSLLDVMGFPVASEMPGTIFTAESPRNIIETFGDRTLGTQAAGSSDDYYESLKSLGYIQ